MRLELVWKGKEDLAKQKPQNSTVSEVKSKRISSSTNAPIHKIFEGDNLLILENRREEWKEKFKLIYIDPPYNTGNTDFFYKDKFKAAECEDSHTNWLNFIYPRLVIAKDILHEQGAIFISIDDYELFHLKLICDEIFGPQNFVANFVRVNKSGAGHDTKKVAIEYDYVLCYAKNFKQLNFSKEELKPENDPKYKLKDEHVKHRGKYYLRDLDYRGSYSLSLDYGIVTPDGKEVFSGGKFGKPNTWRWSKEKFEWGIKNDFIVFKKREKGYKVYIKQYQFVDNKNQLRIRKIPYRSLINFSNSKGSTQLKSVLEQSIFSYPKPLELIDFILSLYAEEKAIEVLDFFAGSGTTMHATLMHNAKHQTNHKCTLITNNENNICQEVTYPRIKNVIKGYVTPKGKKIEGLVDNELVYYKIK
jgi:adenine-specific DNA-methyltransferase